MKNLLRLAFFGAIMISSSFSFGQAVTRTFVSNPTSTSIDGVGDYGETLGSVSFTAGDFTDGCEVIDVNVVISWAKTAGTCAAPTGGNSQHAETSFSITGPGGTEILALPGTWSGQTTTSSVVTTFSQGSGIPSGTPTTGTFGPNNGNLDNYNGQSPFGNWELNVGDNAAGAPLCIDWYSVTVTTAPDNTGPVLTVSSDITVAPDPESCGAVVTFPAPTATDLCGYTIVQTDGPVSGALFPVGPTTVTFEAEDPYGNVTTESFTVSVTATESVAPTDIIASSINVCGGDEVDLTVNGGSLGSSAQWLWYVGSCEGELIGAGEFISVNPLTTTTYFVLAAGPCNVTTCAEVLINVTEAPSVGFCNVVSPSACGASDGFIEACSTGGTGPYTYDWGTSTGAVNNGLSAGPYQVTVTDAAGCTDVASVALSDPGAEITFLTSSDADNIICQGESVTFTGTGSFQYQYYINGLPVSTQNPFVTTALNDGDVVHVVGIDFDFCSYTAAGIEFTVNDLPIITETITDPSACAESDGLILTSVSGGLPLYDYAWVPTSETTSGILDLAAGPYFLTVTDANGCSTSETYALNDPGADPVTLTSSEDPTNEICAGESITFTASGSADYEFFVNGSSVSTVNPYITSGLTDGQSVVATGTDANNCTATSNIIYPTVNPGPIISLLSDVPGDTVCVGESISFFATGGLSYEFFVDNVSQGAPSPISVFSSSSLTDGQTVSVVGTDSFMCDVSSDTIIVTVRLSPTIVVDNVSHPTDCGASDGNITVSATGGTPAYDFAWSNGDTGSFIDDLNAGSYFVTATDQAGCTSVTSASLSDVGSTPVDLESTATNNTICGLDEVVFTATGASTYVFYVNGEAVTTINPFVTDSLEDGDIVAVTGLDTMLCSATSAPSVFTVFPGIQVGISSSNPTACGAMDGWATALVIGGTPDITYAWTPVPVQTTPTATNLAAGPHVLTVTDANGCEATDGVALSDPGAFSITLDADPPELVICLGTEVEFTASGATSYEYWVGATAVSTDNPYTNSTLLDGDMVTVVATDSNNCTATSSRTYTVNTVLQAMLMFPEIACSNEDTILLTGGTPLGGEYTVVYGNVPVTGDFFFPSLAGANPINVDYTYAAQNGCTSTTSELYQVLLAPQVDLGNDTTVCGITLDAGAGYETYQWTSANDDTLQTVFTAVTGVYGVTVIDANGCVGMDEIGITVNPIPNPVITEGGNVIPNGGTVEYCINTTQYLYAQAGFTIYNWTTNSDSSSTVIPGLVIGVDTVTLTVTNSFGCEASTEVILVVNEPMPGAEIIAGGPLEFCKGESVSLDAGAGYASYLWNTGSTTQTITAIETGCYWPYVLDGNGCIDSSLVSDSVCITVWDPEPIATEVGDTTLSLTNANDFVSYQWYFNDDPIPGATNATYAISESGNYKVCVTDDKGCEGCSFNFEKTYNVGIEESFFEGDVSLYPNPNNGQFTLEIEMQRQMKIRVGLFDIIGKRVWMDQNAESTSSLRKQYDVSNMPDGVYFVRIYADNQMTVKKLIKQ